MSEDIPVAPAGTYHSREPRCYLCGTRYGELVQVVAPETRAWAWRCDDITGCERRRNQKRQLRLFGKASMRTPRRAA